jgi:hypothetical protein
VRSGLHAALFAIIAVAGWWSTRRLVRIESDAAAIEQAAAPAAEELVASRSDLRKLIEAAISGQVSRPDLDPLESRLDIDLLGLFDARFGDRRARRAIEEGRAALARALNQALVPHAIPAESARTIESAGDRLDEALAYAVSLRLARARELAAGIGEAQRRAERDIVCCTALVLACAAALVLLDRRRPGET